MYIIQAMTPESRWEGRRARVEVVFGRGDIMDNKGGSNLKVLTLWELFELYDITIRRVHIT